MNFFKNCNTIAEAKKLFKTLAFQLHPDTAKSNGEAFKAMLNEFQNLKFSDEQDKHFKYAGSNKDFAFIINQLITNDKLKHIEFEIIGSWIWLSNTSKEIKEIIKEIITNKDIKSYCCRWINNKKRWVYRPVDYRKYSGKTFSMDEIRNQYGSEKGNKKLALN